jgi:pimeloyl-ACP methyl ester carboxylesterase
VAAIPGARLVMLRGCGHVPTYDDPELVARVLLEGSAD